MRVTPITARAAGWAAMAVAIAAGVAMPAQAQSIDELRDMSITSLANLDVSSISKIGGTLADAPASIYVITHDDIVRSGNITLSGILRLAPNLEIMRGAASSGGSIITARGMGGNGDAQNFPNKLLVLIDGRSVYTPLYSGVYWDMQDILPEDVERIEVQSGPGATLWGANAFNGVINVITRHAGATQGAYATAVVGNRTRDAGIRYGGRSGDNFSYRLFAKAHRNLDSSAAVDNDSYRLEGGFRLDWSVTPDDQLMLQGNSYRGARSQTAAADEDIMGSDIVARWNRSWDSGSTLQVQAYYDRNGRKTEQGGGKFVVNTLDLDIQHSIALGSVNRIVWGGGLRSTRYNIDGNASIQFVPDKRRQYLANIFAQDNLTITSSLTGIVGLKYEHDPYSGGVLLPNARLAWKPVASLLLWGAASRAIRSPTPFDTDVVESAAGTTLLTGGGSNFRSEKLYAYELGTRLTASETASFSFSAFYNDYGDLRSIETAPGAFFPLRFANGIKGRGYGFDSWADIRLTNWWKLKPAYSLLIQHFDYKPGTSTAIGLSQVTNDPKHRASLRSSMDIGPKLNVDWDVRYVSALRDPYVKAYVELGARLGWMINDQAEFSVSGFNLLHKRHRELPPTQGGEVSRSGFVALKWHI